MTANHKIGIVILTYRAAAYLPRLLALLAETAKGVPILIVDSTSDDGTVDIAQEFGTPTLVIPKSSFNHGATREMARKALQTDIVVMLTQDVIPHGAEWLANLTAPIVKGEAAVAYARQVPHDGAGWFEAFPRAFNYPDRSELRGIDDVKKYGAYTFFCSDSCAAWSNVALDEIGGLPYTISLEDTIAAALLIRRGYKIAYCADAVVKHSHSYTLRQEYQRYFITGYVRRRHRDLLCVGDGDERRGATFVGAMLKHLVKEKPWLIPYAVISSSIKLLGYRAGWYWNLLFSEAL